MGVYWNTLVSPAGLVQSVKRKHNNYNISYLNLNIENSEAIPIEASIP